jgi:hypothetical protein
VHGSASAALVIPLTVATPPESFVIQSDARFKDTLIFPTISATLFHDIPRGLNHAGNNPVDSAIRSVGNIGHLVLVEGATSSNFDDMIGGSSFVV